MFRRHNLRGLMREVIAGLVVAAIVALIGIVSDAQVSPLVWVAAGVTAALGTGVLVGYLRIRRIADEALHERDALKRQIEESTESSVKARVRIKEADRRAEAAEARAVAANDRAADCEESARVAHAEREQAEELLSELRRWEHLEEHTGLCDYWRRLDGSEEHPQERLDRIHRSLDFMGHGASKWTAEREKFAEMANRLANNNFGKVRMLLLNPDCEPSREKSRRRFNGDPHKLPRRIVQSLLILNELQEIYSNLSVKLYAHVPHFRLTVVDGSTVIVGHYREGKDDSARTPLIAWEKNSDWSFFTPFEGYFDHEWQLAKEVDWDLIQSLSADLEASPA